MNRINEKLNFLKKNNRKVFIPFATLGYPDLETTKQLIKIYEKSGADMIEIGIPFSDPVADGPTIQFSSDIALRNGVCLDDAFNLVKEIRKESQIPIIFMSYFNPIFHMGIETVAAKAVESGVDGFIIPDIIPEECSAVKKVFDKNDLSQIFLAAPNTPVERLEFIDRKSNSFVYIVSVTGVTGARKTLPDELKIYLENTKKYINHPRILGFGISSADHVKDLKEFVDGVIVASAIIEIVRDNNIPEERNSKIERFMVSLRKALDE